MSNKIKEVSTLVKTKFVGLYEVEYKNKNDDIKNWIVASRKNENQLRDIYFKNKEDKIDAVVICAFHENEKKLVLINQFRIPINSYIYELPAGLVDDYESIQIAVKRELKEETGLDIVDIISDKQKLYLSPGMTDESVAFVYCTCKGNLSKNYLEEDEDINALLVSRDDAINILNSNEKIDAKLYLILQMFAKLGNELFEIKN